MLIRGHSRKLMSAASEIPFYGIGESPPVGGQAAHWRDHCVVARNELSRLNKLQGIKLFINLLNTTKMVVF